MFWCLIVTGVVEPYVSVFYGRGHIDLQYKVFYWTSTAVFSVDFCLRFFRAQKQSTRDGVVLVTHLPQIARMYMRTWSFYIDLVSALPLSPLAYLLGIDVYISQTLAVCRMVRLLKFARLHGTFFRIHDVSGWSFSAIYIFQFVMMSALVLHWIACVWASLVTNDKQSWFTKAEKDYQFLDFDADADMYLMSLYWSVTVLTQVGFGDITPQARAEFFWAIVCMGVGGTVWAYVVGNVCGISAGLDKHRDEFKNLLNDVSVLCAERHLPWVLQERVEQFYKHSKDFIRMKSYHHTVRDLSPALKGEVLDWMYGNCFKRVWYFDVVDERCSRLLTEGMVPKMYAPEESVEDTLNGLRCLVFLRSGLCVRKNNLLAPGAVWGLDVILGSEEHHDIEELLDTALAKSIHFCFVMKLGKNTIDHAAGLVPAFARRLRKAHLRMLFWRGAIAASRAQSRLDKPESQILHTSTPVWDRAGKMMAKVLHQDCQLIHHYEESSTTECTKLHNQLVAEGHDHPVVMGSGHNLHDRSPSSHLHRVSSSHNLRDRSPGSHLHRMNSSPISRSRSMSFCANGEFMRDRAGSMASVKGSQDALRRRSVTVDFKRERRASAVSFEVDVESLPSRTEPQLDVPSSIGDTSTSTVVSTSTSNGDVTAEEIASPDLAFVRQVSVESGVSELWTDDFTGLSDADWKARVNEKMEVLREDLANTNDALSDEVGSMREEVSELTRMMHQLLLRLDADEKY